MNGAEMVDHLVFGNNHGMRVIAGSINDPSLVSKWESWLRGLVRLETFQGHQPPPTALSYLALDEGRVAVVRRSDDEAGALARGQAHVLIGPAAWLTPTVALGLHSWGRWNKSVKPGDPLDQVSMSELIKESKYGGGHLQEQAVIRGRMLKPVLAALAARPGERIVVLGCVDDDILPVLWGLHRIAGTTFTNPEDWTFSSYEPKRLDARDAPRIVFLPERPQAYTTRTQVDVQDDKPADLDPRVVNWVNTSVDDFARRTDDAFAPAPSVAADEQATQRIAVSTGPAGTTGRQAGGVTVAAQGPGMMTARTGVQGHEVEPVLAGGGSGPETTQEGSLPLLYRESRPAPGEPRHPGAPPSEMRRTAVAADLLRTGTIAEFAAAFDGVRWKLSTGALLRPQLMAPELIEVFDHAASLTEPDQHGTWASALLAAVLGPDSADIRKPDGLEYVKQVVRASAADAANSRRARPLVELLVKDVHANLGGMGELTTPIVDTFFGSLGFERHGPEPRPTQVAAVPGGGGGLRSWLSNTFSSVRNEEAGPGDPPTGRHGERRATEEPEPRGRNVLLIAGLVLLAVAVIVVVAIVLSRIATTVSEIGTDQTPVVSTAPPEPTPVPTADEEAPTDGGESDGSFDSILPEVLSVPEGVVPTGQVAYIIFRGEGNSLYIGPECTRDSDNERYLCERGELPSDFTSGLVKVATSTPEVRDRYEGRRISRTEWPQDVGLSLPEGMTQLDETVES